MTAETRRALMVVFVWMELIPSHVPVPRDGQESGVKLVSIVNGSSFNINDIV